MKKFNLFSLAVATTIASFTACTNDAEEILFQEKEIKLTSEIKPTSRVTDLAYQSNQIIENQQVGITITGAESRHDNVAWLVGRNGTLTNTGETIYWSNTQADITAYHPYNSSWTGTNHSFSVNTDQSKEANYCNSDLLWATATATKTETPVALTFLHKLAKINVTLTSTNATDLSGAIISICGTNITTNFNPATGELSNATTANIQEIKAGITTEDAFTASAIVIPQTVNSGTKFIKVSLGSKIFYYTLNADKVLKSGYSHNYTLTIKGREEMELKSNNIADWENENDNIGDAEEIKTLLLPDAETFNITIGAILDNNNNLKNIKFIANSETTSENKLVTDEDGTIGYIVENGKNLEIHSSAKEFIASSNCGQMFSARYRTSFNRIVSIDFGEKFNTSNTTDMGAMFQYCSSLTSLDLSTFDTSKVTMMNAMFDGCNALTSLDLSTFDTSSTKDISYMFAYCQALNTLDISSFNTSNTEIIRCMFQNCSALKTLDVSKLNTSSVTHMEGLFEHCHALTTLDVSKFNTSNASNMEAMFANCNAITSLDLSSFSFQNDVTVSNMLANVGKDATNTPIAIKVTTEGHTYLTETTTDCNIDNNYAKFVQPDGSDW
jgi:surface protein